MGKRAPMMERIVKILSRTKLDELVTGYTSIERPWHHDRKNLEGRLIFADCDSLREELLDYVAIGLRISRSAPPIATGETRKVDHV